MRALRLLSTLLESLDGAGIEARAKLRGYSLNRTAQLPTMTNQDPTPKTALVTGASLRIGRAISIELAQRGWRVGVHHYLSAAEAETLVAEIEALGAKAVPLQADLSKQGELSALVEAGLGDVERLLGYLADPVTEVASAFVPPELVRRDRRRGSFRCHCCQAGP